MLNHSKLFTSLALAPLLLSVEAQGAINGANCNGNTCTNIANRQVQIVGNEAAKTINITNPLGGRDIHSVLGASIGLNGAQLRSLNITNAINKTNRNILWLHDSILTTFTNAGTLTSTDAGQAVNVNR